MAVTFVVLGGRKRRLFPFNSRRDRKRAPAIQPVREVLIEPRQKVLAQSGRNI